ncbi:TolC family outer membrane protein [Ramlibacter henchirensis]|uniref:TolC family outer membrane protein n=1 Tax=Ramlibacter henchirensis TaxID=204072 RepID=UPI001F11237A|nr:TolC family outer membrane protein [Ramlibacter henchirensis]
MSTAKKNKLRLVAAAALLAVAAPSSFAISLVEAYEAAVKNDPVYRSAQHENEAAQQFAVLGRSNLLPSIAATYAPSRNRADVTNTGVGGGATDHRRYSALSANLQLRQPLYHPEGMARYRQGVAQTKGSDAQFAGRSQELIVRLASAYTFAKYAEDQLALAVAQRDALSEQRRTNQRLFLRGEGTRTDVVETQARLDLAVAQVLEANDNVRNARDALSAIVGQDVSQLDALTDDFRVKQLVPGEFADWRGIALSTNPEIQARRHAVDVAQEEANRHRAGHLPRLDLVASAGRNDSESITTFNQKANIRSVGVQLNVPLYSGGAVSAAVAQAESNAEKAKADLDVATNEVLIELRKQFDLTASSVARLDAARAALDSATLLVEATRRSVAGGQRINLDVLQAQQQLFDARRTLAQARYNHLLSLLRLRFAAGVLQMSDLVEMASYFKPVRAGG